MSKMSLKQRMYTALPLLIWFLLLVMPFISVPRHIPAADHERFLKFIVGSNLLLLGIFYIHTYLLYRLLERKQIVVYLLALTGLLAIYCCYDFILRPPPPNPMTLGLPGNVPQLPFDPGPPGGHRLFMPVLSLFIVLLCSFCYRILMQNALRKELMNERERIHLRTELNFLRSQINPHFLFNTLNNLTSLARINSRLLEPAIVDLSQLMRYMLYDSDDSKVPLSSEIAYLQSYIGLQQLRFGNELVIKTNFDVDQQACEVDPMLFIPLVENAFKYGTEQEGNNIIIISLNVHNNKLSFKVTNYFHETAIQHQPGTGIGLKNLRRRLAILYPDKHHFNSFAEGDKYTAELTIALS